MKLSKFRSLSVPFFMRNFFHFLFFLNSNFTLNFYYRSLPFTVFLAVLLPLPLLSLPTILVLDLFIFLFLFTLFLRFFLLQYLTPLFLLLHHLLLLSPSIPSSSTPHQPPPPPPSTPSSSTLRSSEHHFRSQNVFLVVHSSRVIVLHLTQGRGGKNIANLNVAAEL